MPSSTPTPKDTLTNSLPDSVNVDLDGQKPQSASSRNARSTPLAASSLSSLKSLMGLQLFTRLFTFILNQALFRMASPKAYGIAAIQFELMLSTILFLSREGVRGALLRVKSKSSATERDNNSKPGETETDISSKEAAMNVGFIPILFGVPLAIGTSLFYMHFASNEAKAQGYFDWAVALYALAAIIELLAEPMHNMAMAELKTHVRVRAEGAGITCKTLLTFVVLVADARRETRTGQDLTLVAFALGQLVYGSCVLGMTNSNKPIFDKRILSLSMTMTSQSFVKHFLTEGDKLILSWFSPLQDQGGYAVAVNYGSLIARIVFQPIEETLRIYFSKTLADLTVDAARETADSTSGSASGVQVRARKDIKKSSAAADPNILQNNTHTLSALTESARALMSLLHIQIVASLFILIFGSAYISLVLHVVLPAQYLETSAPQVLQAWVWYIPVLAINGGLEAFLSSVGDKGDMNRQSRWMVLFSVVYITTAVMFYAFGLGDTSLVYANIVNLSARILYVLGFCSTFFKTMQARYHLNTSILDWKEAVPSITVLVALLLSGLIVRMNEAWAGATELLKKNGRSMVFSLPVLQHVGLGGGLAVLCVAIWWKTSMRRISMPGTLKK
ncbi:Rft-1-domain-containing protein [Dendrothele bispora CBS 962.96]|uniref:Man(5)GlcNAc(2)-PP-dolichol translocation protein RFT1 n=1 Tax=Dendrothele bispora (strain CBS 962.96) TaxID=1314807 RepID=A0A4S8MZY5_DENBC|nr:Rft-1-domain-containing protein [Dendrothele bispora CBS 962.96]